MTLEDQKRDLIFRNMIKSEKEVIRAIMYRSGLPYKNSTISRYDRHMKAIDKLKEDGIFYSKESRFYKGEKALFLTVKGWNIAFELEGITDTIKKAQIIYRSELQREAEVYRFLFYALLKINTGLLEKAASEKMDEDKILDMLSNSDNQVRLFYEAHFLVTK